MALITPEEHKRRILVLDKAWKSAASDYNLDGMMAIYSEDAREILPGMPVLQGIKDIREFYRGLIKNNPRFSNEFDAQEIIISESGDLAVIRGNFKFMADKELPDEIQTGKYVGVWKNEDGDWRLKINISNSD